MPEMAAELIDQPTQPREEERLDTDALQGYLAAHLEGFDGQLTVRQFPRGHSNLTYWISDGEREWVLRRPPFGSQVKSAHDMSREHRVLKGLYRAYPRVPRSLLYCDDADVIGAPFYVMERIEGIILRKNPPPELGLVPERVLALSQNLVDNLAAIHAVDLEEAGLSGWGKPEGYVRRQVEGWTARYAKSKTDEIVSVDAVAKWLAERTPESDVGCLIHNDFKYDNLILDPDDVTRIIGVLDWEMATVGHPLMDLGTSLSYWIEPHDPAPMQAIRFIPTHLPGTLTRGEVIARYAEASGRDVGDMDFYLVFGLFKTAVVAQQIYYRFATGKTHDPRFAGLIEAVRILSTQAHHVAQSSRL